MFGRVQVELDQRGVRASGASLENRPRSRGLARVDGAPARKTARQNFERQNRGGDFNESLVRLLGASGGRGFPQELPELRLRLDKGAEPCFP